MFTNGANATPPSTPTATSISITSGVTGGGTVDTLTGTNLTSASSVTIGGNPATNLTVNSATSVTFTVPAGSLGAQSLVVTTPGGTATLNNAFTYFTTLTPACSVSGSFTITGTSVTGNSSCSGTAVIPSGVTDIGLIAFYGDANLTSVSLPEGLKTINDQAFRTSGLLSVNIPSTVTSIGYLSFSITQPFSSVNFASGGANNLTIGQEAFQYFHGRCVVLPSNLTSMEYRTFEASLQLQNVYFAGNAPTVTGGALYPGGSITAGAVVQYKNTATGFTNPWQGLTSQSSTFTAPAYSLTSSSESATIGTAIRGYSLNQTGGSVGCYSIFPAPSAGLTFDNTTGILSGTPTAVAPTTTYTITGANGGGSTSATFTLVVTNNPTIASLTTTSGIFPGGTRTTIIGTNLTSTNSITVGGNAATNITVNSSTSVSFTTPRGTVGAQDVVVTTPSGSGTKVGGFTYFTPPPDTVTFESNGGTAVASASVAVEGTLAAPTAPTRPGYTFNGWSTQNGGSPITFPYTANQTSSFILYALWSKTTGVPSWNVQSAPSHNGWSGVGYGNGLFVAVTGASTGPQIMISQNGTNWTVETATSTGLTAVTYGMANGTGIYVAVGTNQVFTSPDGITWTARTAAAANAWSAITFGNGLFVAVASSGSGNRVMTSPDGITWTARTSAANNSWDGISYGNGKFVAVAISGTGNRIMTSSDGITWTLPTYPAGGETNYYSVAYGNGIFVAMGSAATSMISSDGVTWTQETQTSAVWVGVAFGDGLFFAVSQGGGTEIISSTDGITWTTRPFPFTGSWRGTAFGNGMFVAVEYGNDATPVMSTGPKITSLSVTSGPLLGGTVLQAIGTNLGSTTAAYVDGTSATLGTVGDTSTVITTPTGATVGAKDVRLTTNYGPVTLPGSFTYIEEYPVTYNGNTATGGTQASGMFVVGTPLTLPVTTTFTKTGYTFLGWAASSGSTTPVTTYSTRAIATFYAIWTPNSYGVIFNKNSVSATGTMTTETANATTALTLNTFQYANHTFMHWNTNAADTGTQYTDGQNYQFIAPATLYAQWGYAITYTTAGADAGTPSRTYEVVNTAVTVPSVGSMVRAGYTFAGWSVTPGGTLYSTNYTPIANVTLNPVWTPKTYTITYNSNGLTTGTAPNNQTWAESTTALTLSGQGSLAWAGYTFGGWSLSPSAPATAITTFSSTSETTTATLYAIWTPISYTITYNLNNGDLPLPTQSSLHINDTFIVAAAPTRSGYIFGGWSDSHSIYAANATYRIATSNVTLVAQWNPVYTLHYILNGSLDTPTADTTTLGGTVLQLADTPTLTGYTFAGWLDSNTVMHAPHTNFTIIQNSNMTAQWTPINYTITYNTAGATSDTPTQSSLTINSSFVIAAAPTRAGYLFTGWQDSNTFVWGERATYTINGSNISFTAQWTAINYSVTYDLGGGYLATPPTQSAVNISVPFNIYNGTAPTWLAHTFTGWSDGTRTYSSGDSYTPGARNITLTAQYSLNGYTQISYSAGVGGVGTPPATFGLLEGDTFLVASGGTVSNPGNSFTGWSDGRLTYQPNDTYYVGPYTSPVTLTAQWLAGYTVVYVAGPASGSVPTDSNSYSSSNTFMVLDATSLSYSGFSFGGWSDGVTTYLAGSTYTVGNSSITFTAIWNANPASSPSVVRAPITTPPVEELTHSTPLTSAIVAAEVALSANQAKAKQYFASLPINRNKSGEQSESAPSASQIHSVASGTSINTQVARTNSAQAANITLPATSVILSDLVVQQLAKQATVVATANGISVTPVAGFTGTLVVPTVATIDGKQVTVLNNVVVNPVAPVGIGYAPVSINKSAISWAPSASQVVSYQIAINGKTACQTTSSSCPVPALIGPKSKVTITAIGNDQTASAPEVIPYAATAPIPALKVNFATASATLSRPQKIEIAAIARVIRTQGFTRLVVNGFADARGSAELNAKLSQARAQAVAAYMQVVLPEIAVKASAFGAKNAIAPNSTAEGQAQNRRTEIATW